MNQQYSLLTDGGVYVSVSPHVTVEIPKWMHKLSTMVSTVYLSSVKIGKEYSKRPAETLPWSRLVTRDGYFVATVGDKDWQQNNVPWRKFLRMRFDPTDTIEKTLLRLKDKASDVAYLCEESVNSFGETNFSFFALEKELTL